MNLRVKSCLFCTYFAQISAKSRVGWGSRVLRVQETGSTIKLKQIMASFLQNLSQYDENNIPDASELRFGIVVAAWNRRITDALYEGCYDTLLKHGARPEQIFTVQVPGSFELTAGAKILLSQRIVDAVICLGCVIKGETNHDDYINQSVATGLTHLGIATGKPHIFGLLTTLNEEQALDRAGGKHGNKGVEAAVTAIRMADLTKGLGDKKEKRQIGFS
jgi:6,7-dimethyl-8-ribityllumazine synthase